MQLPASRERPAIRGVRDPRFVARPSMRLEFDIPEERAIREIENRIGDARRKGDPVEPLIEEKRRTYDAWIARLDRELGEADRKADQDRIRQQRERAEREYGRQ